MTSSRLRSTLLTILRLLILLLVIRALACHAQDTIHFLNGKSQTAIVSEVTAQFIVLKDPPPANTIHRLNLPDVATVIFGPRPEMEKARASEGTARLDALRRVWYLLRPSLELPESPAGQWGLEFAQAILHSDLPDNVRLSFEVFQTIEERDWNRQRRHAARRGRFNAMLNLGLMDQAMAEARKVAADPGQEDPELLILSRMMLGDLAFKELKALESENPRWDQDDLIRPRRNALHDTALDHYFFPHLYHGDRPESAARGLWAAVQLMLHSGDKPAAAARARDLATLYPGTPEATLAAPLAKECPPDAEAEEQDAAAGAGKNARARKQRRMPPRNQPPPESEADPATESTHRRHAGCRFTPARQRKADAQAQAEKKEQETRQAMNTRHTRPAILLAALLLLLAPAAAQEPAQPADPPPGVEVKTKTALDYYIAGGSMMHPILLCSIGTIAVLGFAFIQITGKKMMPKGIHQSLLRHIQQKQVAEAYQLCQDNPNSYTNVVAAALLKVNFERDLANKASMEQAARRYPRRGGNQTDAVDQLPQCLRHHCPDARPARHRRRHDPELRPARRRQIRPQRPRRRHRRRHDHHRRRPARRHPRHVLLLLLPQPRHRHHHQHPEKRHLPHRRAHRRGPLVRRCPDTRRTPGRRVIPNPMATRRRKRAEDEVGFQLAPMIDMTFLLLIFFMLTSTITNLKVKQDVKVPLAPSAVIPKDASNRLMINIDAAGGLFLGDTATTEKALAAELTRQFRVNPPLQLYVRADRAVPAKRIKEIVRMASEAGAVKVIIATMKK